MPINCNGIESQQPLQIVTSFIANTINSFQLLNAHFVVQIMT